MKRKSNVPNDDPRTKISAGTSVDVRLDDGTIWRTKTRSEPWQLGHGDWVVLLEGKSGGYSLSRVMVAQGPTPMPDVTIRSNLDLERVLAGPRGEGTCDAYDRDVDRYLDDYEDGEF